MIWYIILEDHSDCYVKNSLGSNKSRRLNKGGRLRGRLLAWTKLAAVG